MLVGVDGRLAAAVVLADHLRPDARGLVDGLREAGIRHVAMATGDRAAVAEEIGREVGVDRVYAEQTPEEKLELVRSLRADGLLRPVVMVGDGVNDAPALALADVGIAMGAAGGTVARRPPTRSFWWIESSALPTRSGLAGARLPSLARASLRGSGSAWWRWSLPRSDSSSPCSERCSRRGIDVAVILNALRALRG